MFSKSQQFYDALYEALGKNYSKEALTAHKTIRKYGQSGGVNLLDIA